MKKIVLLSTLHCLMAPCYAAETQKDLLSENDSLKNLRLSVQEEKSDKLGQAFDTKPSKREPRQRSRGGGGSGVKSGKTHDDFYNQPDLQEALSQASKHKAELEREPRQRSRGGGGSGVKSSGMTRQQWERQQKQKELIRSFDSDDRGGGNSGVGGGGNGGGNGGGSRGKNRSLKHEFIKAC